MAEIPSVEMTQAQYAKHRGVSRQAINKLIPEKIQLNGNGKIDVAAADFILGQPERAVARSDGDGGGDLTKARTAVAAYEGRLKQLQFEQAIGRLLLRADVEQSMELAGEAIIQEIDRLPAMTDDLAAAFTRDGVKGLQRKLREISVDIRRTIAESLVVVKQEAAAEEEAA